MDILEFLAKELFRSLIDLGLLTGLAYLLRDRISAYLKHFYDKKLEDYKNQELKRQKAILIAELISEWTTNTDKKKLSQLTYEAFIWLPKDIAEKLSKVLSHAPGHNAKDLIAEIRVLVLGQDEKIDPAIIIHFPT